MSGNGPIETQHQNVQMAPGLRDRSLASQQPPLFAATTLRRHCTTCGSSTATQPLEEATHGSSRAI